MKETLKAKILLCIVLASVIAVGLGIGAAATRYRSELQSFGDWQRTTLENDSRVVMATFRGRPIYQSTIDTRIAYETIENGSIDSVSVTERTALDGVIRNLILEAEAEAEGLFATQEEVDLSIEQHKKDYAEYSEVSEGINEYCSGRGISVEEYWDILEETTPARILRAKLSRKVLANHFGRNEEDVVVFGSMKEYNEAKAVEDAYYKELLQKYSDEIVYYEDGAYHPSDNEVSVDDDSIDKNYDTDINDHGVDYENAVVGGAVGNQGDVVAEDVFTNYESAASGDNSNETPN
jgi:hypothetical protein